MQSTVKQQMLYICIYICIYIYIYIYMDNCIHMIEGYILLLRKCHKTLCVFSGDIGILFIIEQACITSSDQVQTGNALSIDKHLLQMYSLA
jgi:hypothetical protein